MPATLIEDAKAWLNARGAPITAGNLNSIQSFLLDNPDQRPSYASGSDIEAAAERKYVSPDTIEQHDLPAMARVMGDDNASAAPPADVETAAGDNGSTDDRGGTIGNKNPPQQAGLDAAIDKSISGGDGNPSMAPAISQDDADGAQTTTAVDDMQQQQSQAQSPAQPAKGSSLKDAMLAALGGAGATALALAARRRPSVRQAVRSEPTVGAGSSASSTAGVAAPSAAAPVEATSSYLNRAPRTEAQARADVAGRKAARDAEREDNMATPYQRQSNLEGPSTGDTPYGRQSQLEGPQQQNGGGGGGVKAALAAQKQKPSGKKKPPFGKK